MFVRDQVNPFSNPGQEKNNGCQKFLNFFFVCQYRLVFGGVPDDFNSKNNFTGILWTK
jgi:hypothetical protein